MPRKLASVVASLNRAGELVSAPDGDPVVNGLTADSRTVEPGLAYFAVRGSRMDGHRFLADAVARGAAAVVVEEPAQFAVPQVVVRNGRRAVQVAAQEWYGDPARQLTLVGVTGTNGKTTTTALVRHLLNAGETAGSMGTLGAFDGTGATIPSEAGSLTTPGPIGLQATLARLVERGCEHVAMEASSHSLDQGRLDTLRFAAAVFTNVTRDHLDYHGTMESYLAAKMKLSGLLAPEGIGVVNADDAVWRGLPLRGERITFGTGADAMVRATGLSFGRTGSTFAMASPWGDREIRLPLLGDYNVANALGAAATALALGRPLDEVADRLGDAPQVPGRMEVLTEEPCVVLRDYAHTPDALSRALDALRPLTRGRLIVVFGCGGDRDRGKRPEMGRIAAGLADVPVVTSDNPRTENPDSIIDDIEAGMAGIEHHRETDRRAAIHLALGLAQPRDIVLLAGKGHEDYQVIGEERLPFDEREIVLQAVGR